MAQFLKGHLLTDTTNDVLYYYNGGWVLIPTENWDGSTVTAGTITTLTCTTINVSGGGEITLNNNKAVRGLDTGAGSRQLVKVNASNQIVVGNSSLATAFINALTTTKLYVAGTSEVNVTGSLVTIVSNDLHLSSGRVDITNPDDESALQVNASSGSMGNAVLFLNAHRSASSAYDLITAYSGNTGDLEFKVRGDGEVTADGSFTGGGADLSEFMEWLDGNPNNEDRRGIVVTVAAVDGHKFIKPAAAGDPCIGVVSTDPTIVGGSDGLRWQGKFKLDDWGMPVIKNVPSVRWEVEERPPPDEVVSQRAEIEKLLSEDEVDVDLITELEAEILPEEKWKTYTRHHAYPVSEIPKGTAIPKSAIFYDEPVRVVSDEFDPDREHLTRADRPEWDTIGVVGFVLVRDGQPTDPRWINFGTVANGLSRWLIR